MNEETEEYDLTVQNVFRWQKCRKDLLWKTNYL